jgi:hypothetical protein
MTRRLAQLSVCGVLCGLFGSTHVFAQSGQPLQLGAGYQWLHQSVDRGGASFPFGGYVEVEKVLMNDPGKSLGWMAQFEVNGRNDSGFSEQLYTALGGVRLASTKSTRWVPSGFGLAGLVVANASCDIYCVGADKGFALQGGFAMSTRLTPSMLFDISFKATKLKISSAGAFDVAIAAGVRRGL